MPKQSPPAPYAAARAAHREYLDAITPQVQRMIGSAVLRRMDVDTPECDVDDVCCTAALEFVRRSAKLPVHPMPDGKLPQDVRIAVFRSVQTAIRSLARHTVKEADIMVVAMDVAVYRDAINCHETAALVADIDDAVDYDAAHTQADADEMVEWIAARELCPDKATADALFPCSTSMFAR